MTETKCFDEEQRQALLSVVELGFATLSTHPSATATITHCPSNGGLSSASDLY